MGLARSWLNPACGAHLVKHGRVNEAERHLQPARTQDPQYINTGMQRVILRILQGRLDDAQTGLDAVQDIAAACRPVAALQVPLDLTRADAPRAVADHQRCCPPPALLQPTSAVAPHQRCCSLAPEHPGCPVGLAGAMGASERWCTAGRAGKVGLLLGLSVAPPHRCPVRAPLPFASPLRTARRFTGWEKSQGPNGGRGRINWVIQQRCPAQLPPGVQCLSQACVGTKVETGIGNDRNITTAPVIKFAGETLAPG